MSKAIKFIISLIVVVFSIVYLAAYAIPNIFKANEEVKQAERELAQSQMEVDKALEELDTSMEQLCNRSTEC